MEKHKIINKTTIFACCGFVAFLLSGLAAGIGGIIHWIPSGTYQTVANVTVRYGVRASIDNYWGLWRGWSYPSAWGFIGLSILIFAIVFVILEIVCAIIKKKYLYIIVALLHGVSLGFLPYLLILGTGCWESGRCSGKGSVILAGATFLCIASIVLLALSFSVMFEKEKVKLEDQFTEIDEPDQPEITENDVRQIIAEELERHINELHVEEFEEVSEPVAPAPSKAKNAVVEEEPVEKEPAGAEPTEETPEEESLEEESSEEPESEEAEEGVSDEDGEAEFAEDEESDDDEEYDEDGEMISSGEGEEDPFGNLRRRRRVSFETRLKKAEPDLRHKYYELRDYIKSYGIKNRISIPGDSFSAHRERYAFVTFQGKHIKAYFALNPDDYVESPIPVRKVEAKKFEDLPCMLRIQSDLSLKRAKKLVDDVMAKRGVTKVSE